jgi:mono/diheme cytochrome c family protein
MGGPAPDRVDCSGCHGLGNSAADRPDWLAITGPKLIERSPLSACMSRTGRFEDEPYPAEKSRNTAAARSNSLTLMMSVPGPSALLP